MTSKRYVMLVVSLLYVFMILNLALWHGIVRQTFFLGNMNRLGSFISTESLTPNVKYSEKHTELRDYIASGKEKSFDVITLGDSFTNGGGRIYYQDYLKEKYGIESLNARFKNNCLEDLYILIQSGILDEVHPKAVIIECVEYALQYRLGDREIDSEIITRREANKLIMKSIRTKTASSVSSGFFPDIAVKANKTFIFNRLYHYFKPEQLSTEVYITELDRNFFTNPGYEHTLLHYYEDLNYINSPVNANMVNLNINNAAKILREKNIQLIFFTAADKYDLYYPYIINHKGRPENNFFPEIRKVSPKDYVFIDTMKIFREALERGEKDVYWFGDTHWSWKGMQLFCDELAKHFDWLN